MHRHKHPGSDENLVYRSRRLLASHEGVPRHRDHRALPHGVRLLPWRRRQPCQTTKVCENAAALSAAAAVTDEGTDYEPPEITRLLPEGPIMLEYGTNYLSSGNTPFEPCTNGASRDAAEASYTAGDGDGMQYACAMTAFDEFDDEDSTEFIQVRQVIVGSENYFNIEQQGSGVIRPRSTRTSTPWKTSQGTSRQRRC